jgi:hypothetical protein
MNREEAHKTVEWNSKNPVGTTCEWRTPCGKISQLKVETVSCAFPGDEGKATAMCKIIGLDALNGCTTEILIDQLKPINPEEK